MAITDITRFVPISADLATSGQPSAAQLGELATAGFQLIINLGLHNDPRYSLADEPGTVAELGMDYIHIPVPFAAPALQDLHAFFDALRAAQGRRTLVHCAHNKRVSVFLALHRICNLGWPRAQALTEMRKVWQPDPAWLAFIDQTLALQVNRA